jgi:hypothetical protein
LLDFPPSSFGEGRLLALRELDLALAESEDWVSAAAILVLLSFRGFIFFQSRPRLNQVFSKQRRQVQFVT